MHFPLAFSKTMWYNIARNRKSGCGAVGSALDWGSRGREFKSRHSDQEKEMGIRPSLFLFPRGGWRFLNHHICPPTADKYHRFGGTTLFA